MSQSVAEEAINALEAGKQLKIVACHGAGYNSEEKRLTYQLCPG